MVINKPLQQIYKLFFFSNFFLTFSNFTLEHPSFIESLVFVSQKRQIYNKMKNLVCIVLAHNKNCFELVQLSL